jgi:outer membrane protein TolC
MSKLRFTSTTFAFVACVAALCILRLPSSSSADATDRKSSTELVKLQQEQVATLREASNVANQLFAHGLCPVSDADRINHMLAEAELDAAASPQERVQILQKAIDAAKKQEDLASKQAKAGVANALAPLEAKSYRLGLEVKLSAENSK